MAKFIIHGTDAFGNRISENIEITPRTWRDRLRFIALTILPNRIAYAIGLTDFRYISGVTVKHSN